MSTSEILARDFYSLLGVGRDASIPQIELAYRDLNRIYSPDSDFFADIIVEPPQPEHMAVYQAILQAYETLIDPSRRAEYDAKLDRSN